MALQDDIFDVQDALKGKPESKSFNRIIKHLNAIETNYETQEKVLSALGAGLRALNWIKEEYKK